MIELTTLILNYNSIISSKIIRHNMFEGECHLLRNYLYGKEAVKVRLRKVTIELQ